MEQAAKILNNEGAARALGVTPKTLRWWRHIGRGPKFIKYGTSKAAKVGYDAADIQAWLNERKFASTSAYSPAALASSKARNGNPAPSWLQPTR